MSVKTKVEQLNVQTNLGSIAASCYAGSSTTTYLLIHGLGGAKEHFSEVFNFAGESNLFVPDLLGFGESSRLSDPACYTPAFQARAISESMHPDLKKDVVLVLHSMASMLAQRLSRHMNIREIYLLEGNLIEEDCEWSSTICSMDKKKYEVYFQKLQIGAEMVFRKNILCKDKAKIKEWAESYLKMDKSALRETACRLLSATAQGDIFDWILSSGLSVRYLRGSDSSNWSGIDTVKKCGWGYIEVPDARHFSMMDNPSFVFGKAIKL